MILTNLVLFYNKHKEVIDKAVLISLVVVNVIILVIVGWLSLALYKQGKPPEVKFSDSNLIKLQQTHTPKALMVSEQVLLAKNKTTFDAWFKLTNPNNRFDAKVVAYNVDLIDANGLVHDRRSGQTFVLAESDQEVVITNLSSQNIQSAKIRINLTTVWTRAQPGLISELGFNLSQISYNSDNIKVAGVVKNTASASQPVVMVKGWVIVKGEMRAVASTVLHNLIANSSREFAFLLPGSFSSASSKVIIKTEINPWR